MAAAGEPDLSSAPDAVDRAQLAVGAAAIQSPSPSRPLLRALIDELERDPVGAGAAR